MSVCRSASLFIHILSAKQLHTKDSVMLRVRGVGLPQDSKARGVECTTILGKFLNQGSSQYSVELSNMTFSSKTQHTQYLYFPSESPMPSKGRIITVKVEG